MRGNKLNVLCVVQAGRSCRVLTYIYSKVVAVVVVVVVVVNIAAADGVVIGAVIILPYEIISVKTLFSYRNRKLDFN